jgi:alpha-methylacyl-CoA racemase
LAAQESLEGALRGIKVLDLSRLLPGPFASLTLADLGAQVDKVEELGGDYLRHMPPLLTGNKPGVTDVSAIFAALNRGKRSIALDLKKPRAREALLTLAARYDVLLEQFRPGVLERLGLSHATLRAKNPRLVVCALTGYGQTGPLAQRAGHDLNYLARAGVLGQQGPAGGPPAVPGFQLADVGGALWAVVGILAALARRGSTGEGNLVDVAMVEASMGFAIAGFGALFAGTPLVRGEEPLTGGLAGYSTYATKDGKLVALGALEPKFLMAFCQGVGEPFDPTALLPGPHQRAFKERFSAIFLTRTRDEWTTFGEAHDCCLEPVLLPVELAGDPHLAARDVFFTIDSPWGPLRQLRLPVTDAHAMHAPPPALGEHTDTILREAGFESAAIASLKAEGAAR